MTAPAVDEQTRAYVVVEVRTRPPLSRLYPPQQSLACAVKAYAHANALPVARPMTCLREGEEQAWQLDVHSGGRALVLAVDPYDPGAVPALTDDGLLATTTPRPTRAPRPVLTRVCDVCRQDCTYLDQHTAGPRTARPPRWGCREHGPRPSPVLVRR